MPDARRIAPRPPRDFPPSPQFPSSPYSNTPRFMRETAEDIKDLRRSHADLAARMERLTQRQDMEDQRMAAYSLRSSTLNTAAAVQRCVLFARSRALAILRTGSTELGHRPPSLCAFNSIVNVVLKSQPSDVSLQEFCMIVADLKRRPSIACRFLPSRYYTTYPSAARTSRLAILFDSYKDICEALNIDVHARDVGAYKERCDTSRALRAVQILGVQVETDHDRKILLGHSRVPGPYNSAFLEQRPPGWIHNAWETGFEFKFGDTSTIIPPLATAHGAQTPSVHNTTDFNSLPPLEDHFSITWERMKVGPSCGNRPEDIPGLLRSFFPALVLRTRELTTSCRMIFRTRLQGRYPTELMTTGVLP